MAYQVGGVLVGTFFLVKGSFTRGPQTSDASFCECPAYWEARLSQQWCWFFASWDILFICLLFRWLLLSMRKVSFEWVWYGIVPIVGP